MILRRSLAVTGLLLVVPLYALAQPAAVGDGAAAFARGEYERAAEILTPLAERVRTQGDPAAAFLLGMMYENGLGVPRDPIRACTLYLKASFPSGGLSRVLMEPTMALMQEVLSQLSPEQVKWCHFLANLGFNHQFQQTTFNVGPAHWITLDLSAEGEGVIARISKAGNGKDIEVHRAVSGTRFVSFALTELTAGRPVATPRQFIEAFMWVPTMVEDEWVLTWRVWEVAPDSLVPVVSEDVKTIDAPQPPGSTAVDVRSLARIRVNALGDAEWAVLDEKKPRSQAIATHAEREEVASLERAARAAEANLDPSVTRDPNRAPALRYTDAKEGCWDLLMYGWSSDRTEAITVWLDRSALRPSGSPQTIAVGQRPNTEITVHVFDRARPTSRVCDDARRVDDIWEQWRAASGSLTIELTPVVRVQEPGAHRATIRLVGAQFVSTHGRRVAQSQPITLSAVIGIR